MGLPKTGTRSVQEAFKILGYKVHGGLIEHKHLNNYDYIGNGVTSLDYPKMYEICPSVKFIYTTRDFKSWLRSCRHRFSGYKKTISRIRIFGAYTYNRNLWTEAYERHAEKAQEFIKKNPEKVLTLPLEIEDKWKLICDFTGDPIPESNYPWIGQRKDKIKKF